MIIYKRYNKVFMKHREHVTENDSTDAIQCFFVCMSHSSNRRVVLKCCLCLFFSNTHRCYTHSVTFCWGCRCGRVCEVGTERVGVEGGRTRHGSEACTSVADRPTEPFRARSGSMNE